MRAINNFNANIANFFLTYIFNILGWISKHLQKHRLQELVELGDGFAALAAQGFGLVQNGGNAALLGQRWKRDFNCFN